MQKRFRKIALSLLILFTLNEFIPSTAHPIAFALYEGAVLTLAAAEAIGLTELIMGAVVLTQAAHKMHINHAAAHAACNYIANQQKNQHREGIALTTIGQSYAPYIDIENVATTEIIHAPEIVAKTPHIQRQLEKAYVPQCEKEYIRPVTLQTTHTLSGPITFNYQDTDWQPKTIYSPGGFRTTFGNTYVQMQMVQPEEPIIIEGFELEHEYLNTCLKNIPGFETELDNAIGYCLNTLMHTNAKPHHEKVEARLQFTQLQLPGLYGICLQNLITELLPYYFNTDGSLRTIENCDDFDTKLHEYFLKPLKETKQYKIQITKSLQAISCTHIKESSFLSNVANMFLQSVWYSNPLTRKQKIWSNEYNQKLLRLIQACKSNDWQTAEQYHSNSSDAKKLYDYYFHEYAKIYNQYGIYLALQNDPLWQNKSLSEKEVLKQDKRLQDALNRELLLRHDWKIKLQQSWQIPDNANAAVHRALYELTGISSTSALIDTVFKLISPENPERELLIEAFFNEQGILKDLENTYNDQFGIGSLLLNPESYTICHQFNQLIYAFNAEIDTQRKATIQEALKTITKLIQENNIIPHQLAVQSTYIAIVAKQSTETIKEQIKLFAQPTILLCDIEEKNKLPEISTCPTQEDDETPVYGCGTQAQDPLEDIQGNCLPDLLEPEVPICGGIAGIDIKDTVTSCGWSKGIPAIEIDFDKPSEENLNNNEENKNDEQEKNDKDENDDDNTETQNPNDPNIRNNGKKPNNRRKPWELRKNDPAIDIEKIDFSDLLHLTQEEIELIKKCIELFLETEGFLIHDGALWRILLHSDQKIGSLFELEHAIELHDQNTPIYKLNYSRKVDGKVKEIDIVTDTELIECKAITWKSLDTPKKVERLEKQLLLGQKIAIELQKTFVVVSKNPISTDWKNWLDDNNIKYRERLI